MGAISARNETTRQRWSAFLKSLVGSNRAVSIVALGEKLGELTECTGDLRADIYAYLASRQTVTVERAFFIGEALRACGVAWCSGSVALWAAGHIGPFVSLIANVARREPDLAAWIASLSPVASSKAVVSDLRDAAREALTHYPDEAAAVVLRSAFGRDTDRGCDRSLLALVGLADNAGNVDIAERTVARALLEWAIFAADAETLEGVIDVLIDAEIGSLNALRSYGKSLKNLTPRSAIASEILEPVAAPMRRRRNA